MFVFSSTCKLLKLKQESNVIRRISQLCRAEKNKLNCMIFESLKEVKRKLLRLTLVNL